MWKVTGLQRKTLPKTLPLINWIHQCICFGNALRYCISYDTAEIGVGNSNISSVVHICILVFGHCYQRKYYQISWKQVQFFFQYRFWKLLKALHAHLPAVKWPFWDISIFNEAVNTSDDLFLPCASFKSFVQEIFCWVFINLFACRI